MSESFAQLLEESFASQKIKTGAILTGVVVGVNADMVIVNAGLTSEAVIPSCSQICWSISYSSVEISMLNRRSRPKAMDPV